MRRVKDQGFKKPHASTDVCAPVFAVAGFTADKRWRLPECPSMGGWIATGVPLRAGILHSREKGWSCTWTGPEHGAQ